MELGVGAHEYSLTCQILIGWKHHTICWLVWQESACDAFLLIGRALGWWAWSVRDHCMHFWRENAGELKITKSTLFWQLHAYNQLLNLLQLKSKFELPCIMCNWIFFSKILKIFWLFAEKMPASFSGHIICAFLSRERWFQGHKHFTRNKRGAMS